MSTGRIATLASWSQRPALAVTVRDPGVSWSGHGRSSKPHGGPEWIIVGIVAVVVIFGVNKLPQIARNVGKAQGEFKKGLKEGVTEEDLAGEQPATPTAPPAAAAPGTAPAAGAPTDVPPAASPATPPPTSEAPTPRPADQPPTEQNP